MRKLLLILIILSFWTGNSWGQTPSISYPLIEVFATGISVALIPLNSGRVMSNWSVSSQWLPNLDFNGDLGNIRRVPNSPKQ